MGHNFRQELKIDKYSLDSAALEQPELYAKWGELWAEAVYNRDQLKDRLTLVKGDCDLEIRQKPRDFGWDSDKAPTEAFILNAINTHQDYVSANEQYLAAQKEVNLLTIAKDSFEQRRKMIEVLVDLYKSNYFSGNPKLDKGYQSVVTEMAAEAQTEGLGKSSRLMKRKENSGE